MIEGLQSADDVIARALIAWKPPPKLSLSEWADENFYLSAESSAQAGRWTTLPYQVEPMNAITDPRVERVSMMKSARIGYTKMINAAIGFSIDHDPCSVLVVQPTVDDAKGYSKEEIAPMIRDCPVLEAKVTDVEESGPKDSGNTILHKKYAGGVLSLVGANSGAGFRRVSRKRVFFDEVDGYPPSAGSDGDPIKLGEKRTLGFHDRKIVAGSTPLLAGTSRIEQMFLSGDQRRYHVPCPQCGHFDYFVFTKREVDGVVRGHYMVWPDDRPRDAYFVCSANGCVIEHKHKRDMVGRGEWRASKPFTGHASFHIWAAYSFLPNASWGQLAEEFLEARAGGPDQFKTFVNTVLGEPWQERGEAPDWEQLYGRRELYPIGSVPAGVRFLTAGVDVQADRFVFEIVGWAAGKESWSILEGVIPCDTANLSNWAALDELLQRQFASSHGPMQILMMAIDSGYNTNVVYQFVRTHERHRVIAIKGVSAARSFINAPTEVDVNVNGKRIARGAKVWPLGVDIGKTELYGLLRLKAPIDGAALPLGWCHFPEHGPDYFKQLTAEHLVTVKKERTGHKVHEWHVLPGRENHMLDCRIYARAAASVAGLDRLAPPARPLNTAPQPTLPTAVMVAPSSGQAPAHQASRPPREPKRQTDSRFLGNRGKGWLGKR